MGKKKNNELQTLIDLEAEAFDIKLFCEKLRNANKQLKKTSKALMTDFSEIVNEKLTVSDRKQAVQAFLSAIKTEIERVQSHPDVPEDNKLVEQLADVNRLLDNPQPILDWAREVINNRPKWLRPTSNKRDEFKQSAQNIIKAYKKCLCCFNFYGHKRARELSMQVGQSQDLDALLNIVATFIKTGQTESDQKWYNLFRSPTKRSGLGFGSLRGMFYKEFIQQREHLPNPNLDFVMQRQNIEGWDEATIKSNIHIFTAPEHDASTTDQRALSSVVLDPNETVASFRYGN